MLSSADLQGMREGTCQADNQHSWILYLLETKYCQINARKAGSYSTWSCFCCELRYRWYASRFMSHGSTGFSVQPAVLRQERQGSCFPKKKEIVCMCVHVHMRESAYAVTRYFNKPSSNRKNKACSSSTCCICHISFPSILRDFSVTRDIFLQQHKWSNK